ncbi:MAG TPA: hypothetical protein VIK76_10370 [Pyrinomonadaceae bacterium]|jgi:hypothetical protein
MTPQQPYFPPPSHGMDTVWRNDSVLVMTKEALLPNRCVKCNAPAEEQLKRKLTWHHPALYLLILVSVLIYAVVALVVRKTAIVTVGLCDEHSSARRQNIWITCLLVFLSIASFVLAAVMEEGMLAFGGAVFLLAAAIYGGVTLRVVTPTKIDNYLVWLKGVDRNYLQQFPEWRGQA